jgi:hypothetical protein
VCLGFDTVDDLETVITDNTHIPQLFQIHFLLLIIHAVHTPYGRMTITITVHPVPPIKSVNSEHSALGIPLLQLSPHPFKVQATLQKSYDTMARTSFSDP